MRYETNTAGVPREILRLAVPAFLALVAEPLFLLADSAIVGHLGTSALAGLGVASAALLTAVNVYVFLAYGTTSLVARHLGARDERAALRAGLDGVWLSLLLGAVTAALTAVLAQPICALFGASVAAMDEAVVYLRISALGIPAMLVVLAATGVLRGFQDTRTPLAAAVLGFSANVVLNVLLVHGADLGIAGSAWGTVIAQTGMGLGLLAVVVRRARELHAGLRMHPAGVLRAALGGVPLLIRTLALRAALLLTTWVAAGMGDVQVAAHQVAMTVFSFLAFALDALAIAAQALTGRSLGAKDVAGTRATTALMVRWGALLGVVLLVAVVVLHRVMPPLFTADVAVQDALAAGLLVLAVAQPVAGAVFVLDGVLIGAGDGAALAGLQVLVLAVYVPIVLWVRAHASGDAAHQVAMLWWAFGALMLLRMLGLALRARSDRWLVTGAPR